MPFGHLKDLGPVAYKLSPTQRQNRASLLPIRAHERPEVEEMAGMESKWPPPKKENIPAKSRDVLSVFMTVEAYTENLFPGDLAMFE